MNSVETDRARKAPGVACMFVQTQTVSALPIEKQSKLREAMEQEAVT
jgi:hypothetical protein